MKPTPQAELDGIERFVRDTNNATMDMDNGWDWDRKRKLLTITNEDGSTSIISGSDIARQSPHDHRLDRLRTKQQKDKRT